MTTALDERDGVTTLTAAIGYATREARDRVLASSMRDGLNESHARLDELLAQGG